ncbi:dual specificity protein phosphatase 3 isoform X2 [Lycorma delicatula]
MTTMRKQEEDRITKELNEILYLTRPMASKLGPPSPTAKRDSLVLNCCDEVFPGIYIGDCYCAKNKQLLKQLGITHVLNTAEGKLLGMVDTDSDYYKHTGIKYMGLHLMDLPVTDIACYFYEVSDFIDSAVKRGGKVLVHCLMGLSRSSTCVLAYLMIKEGMTAADALRRVRRFREVRPNYGFLQQLAELDMNLKRSRENSRYGSQSVIMHKSINKLENISSPVVTTFIEDKPKKVEDYSFRFGSLLPGSKYQPKNNVENKSMWLPTGRFMSFQPSLNVYKVHNYA